MKKIISFCLLLSSGYFFSSCNELSGSGVVVTENRSVGSFHALEARQGFDVQIREGDRVEVQIEADDNVIRDVITKVDDDGTLHIGVDHNRLMNVHLKAFVTYQKLDEIHTSSGANVTGTGTLKTNQLDLHASSGSGIELDVDAPAVSAQVSSGSNMKLRGRTKNYEVDASSGGDIDSGELLSENAVAHASSAGDIHLHASVTLDAHASSGGSIHFRGKPTKVTQESNSGGSVDAEN